MKTIYKTMIYTFCMLIVPKVLSAQPTIQLYSCLNETRTVYIETETDVPPSRDGVFGDCSTSVSISTEFDINFPDFPDGNPFLPDGLKVSRVNSDTDVQVEMDWNPNWSGTIRISVFYQQRRPRTFGGCRNDGGRQALMDLIVTRDTTGLGGQLVTDRNVYTSNNGRVSVDLSYAPNNQFPGDITSVSYLLENTETSNELLGTSITRFGNYPLTAEIDGYGDHLIKTNIIDACGLSLTGPSKIISIQPSCFGDINPIMSLSGPDLTIFEEGFRVSTGTDYIVNTTGITDFNDHYTLETDGGTGSNLNFVGGQWVFSTTQPLGSFRIVPRLREGIATYCELPPSIRVFTGGNDIIIEQPCPISLPEDLSETFNYDPSSDPDSLILRHFSYTVRSESQIVVRPGLILESGAELIIEFKEVADSSELDRHYVNNQIFNDFGEVINESRNYLDGSGRVLQSQVKNISRGAILTQGNLYDEFGRNDLNSLSAITVAIENEIIDTVGCGQSTYPAEFLSFHYNPKFISDREGIPQLYSPSLIDGMDNFQVNDSLGTLGWYYSSKNGSAANNRLNEESIDQTTQPYTRTVYNADGEVGTITRAGEIFKVGSNNNSQQEKQEITNNDSYLTSYFNFKAEHLQFPLVQQFEGNFYKRVFRDEEGKRSITYFDLNEQPVINQYFGNQVSPITESYNFYDFRGLLVCSISAKGVNAFKNGNTFDQIDKSLYTYDQEGQLISMEETDGGRTEYIYRADGSVKFSQDAKQRVIGAFSYSNYDRLARLVESGEFQPNQPTEIPFGSPTMLGLVENLAPDDGLFGEMGSKHNIDLIYYDHVDASLPIGRRQTFVKNRPSKVITRSNPYISGNIAPEIITWFSYDERGRPIWEVKSVEGLGVKTIDYHYGPNGNVLYTAYQDDDPTESFYQLYLTDEDADLSKVYISRNAPTFNINANITNLDDFRLIANYEYYLDDSPKRTELGNGVQGIDYIYNIQGALKSINHAQPINDPGKDGSTNNVRPDLFGMTFNYYQNDHSLPSLSNSTGINNYTGNLSSVTWHNATELDNTLGYNFEYDDREQLTNARFGELNELTNNINQSISDAFRLNVPQIDENGNITQLERKGAVGQELVNYRYYYNQVGNQLDSVTNTNGTQIKFNYNEIGQLANMIEGDTMYYSYDANKMLSGIYRDSTRSIPVMTLSYDHTGSRLSKVSYDENGTPLWQTWYLCDSNGVLLAVYAQNLPSGTDPILIEQPVYGLDRIGNYEALQDQVFYELKDHLGNVRATIGKPDSVNYMATMETENEDVENEYFTIFKRSVVAPHLNHTPNGNESIKINNRLDTNVNPIGGGMVLSINSGDTVRAKVRAKYEGFAPENTSTIPLLAGYLAEVFGYPVKGESGLPIFDVIESTTFLGFAAHDNIEVNRPRIFLNYMLYDNNFNLVDFGFDQIDETANVSNNTDISSQPFDELKIMAAVKKTGYIYIYLSNENDQNMTAYFDDLAVNHIQSDVVYAADYYPYGELLDGRTVENKQTRYAFQGEWAEKDEESGFTSFELRQYDSKLGRWISTDPYNQFYSPYEALGNNPVNQIDPDGGFSWTTAAIGAGVGAAAGYGYAAGSDKNKTAFTLGGALLGGLVGGVLFNDIEYFSFEKGNTGYKTRPSFITQPKSINVNIWNVNPLIIDDFKLAISILNKNARARRIVNRIPRGDISTATDSFGDAPLGDRFSRNNNTVYWDNLSATEYANGNAHPAFLVLFHELAHQSAFHKLGFTEFNRVSEKFIQGDVWERFNSLDHKRIVRLVDKVAKKFGFKPREVYTGPANIIGVSNIYEIEPLTDRNEIRNRNIKLYNLQK